MAGEQVDAAVALEHRLTNFEGGLAGVREEVRSLRTEVTTRLDRLNGQVAANTKYRYDHTQEHAVEDAHDHGAATMRRRDLAILAGVAGGIGTVASTLTLLAFEVLRLFVFTR